MENNLINIFFVPEVSLAILAIACLMYGLFSKNNSFNNATNFAALSLILVSFLIYFDFTTNFALFETFFSNTSFTKFFKILTTLGAAASLIISKNYFIDTKINRFEIPTLLLFSTLGMMLMISSKNLMMMYLAIELQSLSLYVVASIKRNSLESAESGVKYFILGALSSGILLYGFSLVYGFTGQTSFDEIYISLSQLDKLPIGLVFGLVFILVGLAFKVSAVPFHMWTPDVYEGAPTSITSYFAVVPKVAGLALLIKFMLIPFSNILSEWQTIMIFISIASMILGAVAAIVQTNIKRLLAYSSIGHIGYALAGVASGSISGYESSVLYISIYVVMNIGAFSCLYLMKKDGVYKENISDLSGISKKNPVLAISFLIILFSLAGIPPLAGFFAKFYIFTSVIEQKMYALAIIGLLTTVISAFYYLKIIKTIYFDDSLITFDIVKNKVAKVTIFASCSVLITFFLYPSLLNETINSMFFN